MTSLQKATTRLLNENRVAGTLAAAGYSVIWFGGWTLLAAAKLVREAACGGPTPGEGRLPARGGWSPRPSIYRDGYIHS